MVIGLPERFTSTVAPASASPLDGQTVDVGCAEEQIGAEGRRSPRDRDLQTGDAVPGGELPAFVELPVVGQVQLGYDAEDLAAVDHHGRVEQSVPVSQRSTDHQHAEQAGGC